MQNRHDQATASAYLRLALPLLARFDVPSTPENYAVWYEYVSGENPELSAAVDEMLENGGFVDEEATGMLYDTFVAALDSERFEDARGQLVALTTTLSGTVNQAGGHMSHYRSSLESASTRLDDNIDSASVHTLVAQLAADTIEARDNSLALEAELTRSRDEVEALRESLERARAEATSDPLTKLANRRGFESSANEILQGVDDARCTHCLLMVDIDRFKAINDSHGHLVGDKVLKFVANTMKNCVKGKDVVARYGGEEFAVLLPDTPFSGAMTLAEGLRAAIETERLMRSDTKEPLGTVTASVGVASYRAGEPLEALIARADEALYRAKRAGRNRVVSERECRATGTNG